jgi:lysozyme family protein
MAKIEGLIPFLIKWECGIEQKRDEPLEALFQRAKNSKYGFVNDPDDRGGATVIGVTFGTFTTYCKKNMIKANPTVEDLKNIDFETWLTILSKEYWDRWKADLIFNQSVANILVNWVWGSGVNGIKIPQKLLGVTADGIVGPKTIEALNKFNPEVIFNQVREAQTAFYYRIVEKNPSQQKFLKGWINRLNDLKFEE